MYMYKLNIWALYYMLIKSHEFLHANHLYINLLDYHHLRVYCTGRISLQHSEGWGEGNFQPPLNCWTQKSPWQNRSGRWQDVIVLHLKQVHQSQKSRCLLPCRRSGGSRYFCRIRWWSLGPRCTDISHAVVLMKWTQPIPLNSSYECKLRKFSLPVVQWILWRIKGEENKAAKRIILSKRIHSALHMSVMLTSASDKSQ